MAKTSTKKQPQIIYNPLQGVVCALMEETLEYMIPCPICDKRVIDVSELPERLIKLRYKCPCRNIVTTPLVAAINDGAHIIKRPVE